jgi:PAS domain-containing protein
VLGPALLIVLAVALVVAASIRRTTLRGLALFNEDIELAIGGQLDAVKDPLGVKPIRDLADTVNYLIARTRVGASVPSSAGSASRGAAPPEAPPVTPEQRPVRSSPPRADAPRTPAASTHNPARVEARIVADPKFRVIEASPECQQLIGVPPKEMIGEHLVQALQSKPLAEAVLTCLGSLPPSGELRSTVRRDQGVPLDLHVSRAGKDQPVVILIRASESRVPA